MHPKKLPHLLVSDAQGNLFPHPTLKMAGRSAHDFVQVRIEELIPLPEGSEIFSMPGRTPYGMDEKSGRFVAVEEGPEGGEAWACAAFMAPAHTLSLNPAYRTKAGAPLLPLFAYAALGELDAKLWAAGQRLDPDRRQDPSLFDANLIKAKVEARLK